MIWNRKTYTVHTIDYRNDLKAFKVVKGFKNYIVYPANKKEMNSIIKTLDEGKDIEGLDLNDLPIN